MTELRARWAASARAVFWPWVGLRGLLFAYVYAVRAVGIEEGHFHRGPTGPIGVPLWDSFINWDAAFYARIAQEGYGTDPSTAAFFPLFPYVIRALSVCGLSVWAAGVLVANVCLYVALSLLHALILQRGNRQNADFAVVGVLVFPTTIFFSALYAESMYFACVLLAFWLAHHQRWALAAVAAALASGTRSAGVLMGGALAVTFLAQRFAKAPPRPRPAWAQALWLALAPLGLVALMALQHWKLGDALGWMHAQALWGRGSGQWPWLPIPRDLMNPQLDYIRRADAVFVVLGLLCAAGAWRRKFYGEAAFALMSLLLPLTTGSCWSATRFVSVLPAVYICWAEAASKAWLRQWLLVASVLASTIYTSRFVLGHWAG